MRNPPKAPPWPFVRLADACEKITDGTHRSPPSAAALALRLAEAESLIAVLRDELAAIDALPAALLRDAFNGQA
jgi:hypothetical protein